jgi:prepilin-type N-terminal cleavage/methylation domain-containing protein
MQIWATGKKRIASRATLPGQQGQRWPARGRPARGFSLLELLVTLMVVVLITSLVTLTVSSGGQDLQVAGQVRSLMNIGQYSLDEAELRGVDYGLLLLRKLDENGESVYGFGWRERGLQGWFVPEQDQEVFAEQFFPPGLELRLELDDSPVTDLSLDGNETATPQVMFYSSGETTPGAVELRLTQTGELLWRIEWDLLGRFTLLRRGLADDDDDFS